MAEPTLKDVLNALGMLTGAVGRLEKGQAALDRGQSEIRAEMATKKDVEALRVETKERFEETKERFDSLDEKVEIVRGALIGSRKDFRDDIDALHKGLVRAVPKDLPSQIRAKRERPSKPAKRRAR